MFEQAISELGTALSFWYHREKANISAIELKRVIEIISELESAIAILKREGEKCK